MARANRRLAWFDVFRIGGGATPLRVRAASYGDAEAQAAVTMGCSPNQVMAYRGAEIVRHRQEQRGAAEKS
jgi:hypothetical protein